MSDEKGMKTRLEESSKVLKGAEEKLEKSRNAIGDSVLKLKSPFEQKKNELDAAMNKAEEPFTIMAAKQQQAKMTMDAAKNKADAAKKVLNAKEIAHQEGKNKTDRAMNDAKSRAERAKGSIEDRQREFQKAGELVKSLIAKIESQGKSKFSGSAPGGKI